jgi:glycosyltransferase involved in cell wall biosynthesis
MMQNETILCVAPDDWSSLWRSRQQIMSRLVPQNRVIYFEPGRNSEQSVISDFVDNLPNYWSFNPKIVKENLTVIPTPSSLPHGRRFLPRSMLRVTIPLVNKYNSRILIWKIRRVMEALEVKSPILWLYNPGDVDLIGKFGEKLACYYNFDETADITLNVRIKDLIRQLDDELTRRVDVVFATSRAQWEHRKSINPNTYFIPNGVDFELFNRALDPDLPIPTDVVSLPPPILGFAGWMGYHIDITLLRKIAEAFPNCSLVLVGPDRLTETTDYRRLHSLSNVHFLGQREMNKLPNYLKAFDVALMPWLLTGHTLSAYPLKLHEYLAAGRASVATALPELRPFSHVIRIAETHDEFIDQIREALKDQSPQVIDARVAIARKNTWENRVTDIYQILQPLLSNDKIPE